MKNDVSSNFKIFDLPQLKTQLSVHDSQHLVTHLPQA
jgi:hypothetical protein